ncbi:MAG TPA: hypothetical protein PLP66_09580, partial [Phycisphaerae bacterium]|nr:hypothetical protein [Phycisphaerae bacterium]
MVATAAATRAGGSARGAGRFFAFGRGDLERAAFEAGRFERERDVAMGAPLCWMGQSFAGIVAPSDDRVNG